MDTWQNADYVFVIDAARASGTPGAVNRFEAHDAPLPTCFLSTSTHDFGVAEAIELSRLMDGMPHRLVVYAIEGRDFTVGSALSVPVEHACREVVVRVVREVHAIAGKSVHETQISPAHRTFSRDAGDFGVSFQQLRSML
jgi:hydrogenase maturation protease